MRSAVIAKKVGMTRLFNQPSSIDDETDAFQIDEDAATLPEVDDAVFLGFLGGDPSQPENLGGLSKVSNITLKRGQINVTPEWTNLNEADPGLTILPFVDDLAF